MTDKKQRGKNVNEEVIFQLITEFLRSKNLRQTANTLIVEKARLDADVEEETTDKEKQISQLEELLATLEFGNGNKFPGGREEIGTSTKENEESEKKTQTNETPYPEVEVFSTSGGTKSTLEKRKRKGIAFSGLLEKEEIEYTDEEEEGVSEEAPYITDSQSSSRAASRSASRTSSILRPRSESVGSTRSSKSVSFITSSDDEEESPETDEWSGDEDPGYTRIPVEDFFQYSDEEDDPREKGEENISENREEKSNSLEESSVLNVYAKGEVDDWGQATMYRFGNNGGTSVLMSAQENNSSISSSISDANYIDLQHLNDSFGQEELEVDKLNEILRDHIQLQRDEYYQESFPTPSELSKKQILGTEKDNKNSSQVERISQLIPEYESFNLTIIFEKGRTGLEENKDFPIEIGSTIAGRYQILQYIGSAAFSKAVRALDLFTQQQVCIKIIKNNKEFFDQSLDEIKLLKYINFHSNPDEKNVLQIFDYFYHKEHLFIVSELLRDNLYEFYKYNRASGEEFYFTLERLKKIAKQCLIALEYIHSLNLIHCDLKPENILIKSYSRCEVKIIDFGSSCFTRDHLSWYVQSRSYRAPEVILGLNYDQKIDIWSLGCIVAELWTGKVLFHNESIPTLLARVIGILGPFDEDMLTKGRCVHKYFTKNHSLFDKRQGEPGFIYIKPKRTSLRSRLKCDDPLFVDFVNTLLSLRPEKRPTATEALKHPFLAS